MGLFSWLFGKRRRVEPPPENAPLPPMRLPSVTSSRHDYAPAPQTKPAPLPDEDEYWIDYIAAGDTARRRSVIFLLASPDAMITGIDLNKRRIRTYRLDRMSTVTNPRTNITLPAAQFFATEPVVNLHDWNNQEGPREVASTMVQQMICQISVVVLMAQAGQGMTPKALDAIMTYIQRDNRFAVRDDFVPKGDKTHVWPILRDRVRRLTPRRNHVLAYVETLNENWENTRRITALNDALTTICYLDGGPTHDQRKLAVEVNAAVDK